MITWKQQLGPKDCPYMVRWVFDFWLFAIRVHHWLHSDDLRYPHDHPWWFVTLCLRGGYEDVSPDGNEIHKPGTIRFRKATHRHSVRVNEGGAWTLLITGPERRRWGFWVKGKFRKRNKYFYEHGHHHPCEAKP